MVLILPIIFPLVKKGLANIWVQQIVIWCVSSDVWANPCFLSPARTLFLFRSQRYVMALSGLKLAMSFVAWTTGNHLCVPQYLSVQTFEYYLGCTYIVSMESSEWAGQADSQLLNVSGNIHQRAGILLLIESFCVALAFGTCHTKWVNSEHRWYFKVNALLFCWQIWQH